MPECIKIIKKRGIWRRAYEEFDDGSPPSTVEEHFAGFFENTLSKEKCLPQEVSVTYSGIFVLIVSPVVDIEYEIPNPVEWERYLNDQSGFDWRTLTHYRTYRIYKEWQGDEYPWWRIEYDVDRVLFDYYRSTGVIRNESKSSILPSIVSLGLLGSLCLLRNPIFKK